MTGHDLYRAERKMNQKDRANSRKAYDRHFNRDWQAPLDRSLRFPSILDTPLDCLPGAGQSQEAHLRIDLRLPHELRVQQVEQVLAVLQAQLPENAPIVRELDFPKWIEFGVLPYLDLLVWQHQTGVRLSYAAMAELLFQSDLKKGEETVRKTTARLANELVTEAALREVHGHAVIENSRKAIAQKQKKVEG